MEHPHGTRRLRLQVGGYFTRWHALKTSTKQVRRVLPTPHLRCTLVSSHHGLSGVVWACGCEVYYASCTSGFCTFHFVEKSDGFGWCCNWCFARVWPDGLIFLTCRPSPASKGEVFVHIEGMPVLVAMAAKTNVGLRALPICFEMVGAPWQPWHRCGNHTMG